MTDEEQYDVTGTGEELKQKLEQLSRRRVAAEYEYRMRRAPSKSMPKWKMIDRIVRYVDRSGDGPESLKDMLRF